MRAPARSLLASPVWGDVAGALALAAAIALVDALVTANVLIGLLVAPPLVVAARRGPWQTAGVLVVCVALAVVAGVWDHFFFTGDHLIRTLVVIVGGTLAVWIAAVRERAERDRVHAIFLAQASVALEEEPRADALLRRLATLAVERLADWCAIHVVEPGGAAGEVIVAHADPAVAHELRVRWAERAGAGPGRVLLTGEAELIEDVRRELRAGATRDPERLRALRELGVRSALSVPLRARGRILATMTLGCADSPRRLRQADLARALDLAAIAAGVLDNLRLLQQTEEARAELERAHERASFLAQAGEILESSLDVERTLADVAHLLVPRFADICTIDVVGAEGVVRRLGALAADPAVQEALDELVSYPVDPDSQSPVARVLRTGRAEVIQDVGDEVLLPIARDARHLELMRNAVGRSALLLPMRAHARTAGVLSLRWSEPHHQVSPDDVSLLEDLCARIALAADNARIYEERDSVARTLARSLLPTELPEIPGFEVGAQYLPATREAGVGGDFYDVFAVRERRWMLIVGDVCGKGATAASLTALARHTLRTAAMTTPRPVRTLEVLNESMLQAVTHGRFVTVACAALELRERQGGRVTVACGGHPAPLVLRADGRVEAVPAVGAIIGAFRELSAREAKVELHPGDTFVLFTDGVTEAGTGTDLLGDAGLSATLLQCRDMSAAEMAQCIAQRAVDAQRGQPRDDIAVVALRALAYP